MGYAWHAYSVLLLMLTQENVLLTRRNGRLQAKLADLGLHTVCLCVTQHARTFNREHGHYLC
jgi:uncharacterized protein (DUF2237 family)